MIKREFLANDEIIKYLNKNSLYKKLYKYKNKNSYMYKFDNFEAILEEYKPPFEWLKKVVVVSGDEIKDKNILALEEISKDKRYKKEFLKAFGNPKHYEFDIKKVFKRLDKVGLDKITLNLHEAMMTHMAFKIALYRYHQIFLLSYHKYLIQKIKYNKLQKSHKKFLKILKLSKKVFDKQIIKTLVNDFKDFSFLLDDKKVFDRFELNFQTFIDEDSFYVKSEIPLYYFKKKEKFLKFIQTN
jgi:hypothetical protein